MDLQPDEIAARAPAYELAFVEAGRALDAQERAVNELRSRAGTLMAADWEFNANARDVIAEYIEPEAVSLALIHRDLALHRAASYVGNARQLGWLFLAFRCGLASLVVEVAAWVVALTEAT